MTGPKLTADRLKELLVYDPVTGVFTNRVTRGSRALAGRVAGSPDKDGYLQIKLDRENLKAHRLAWLYMTGRWPSCVVDHRNGKPSDNRWLNLRDTTHSINSQNIKGARTDSATKLLGVSYEKGRKAFRAQIFYGGKKYALGRFPTANLAHEAYLAAKRKHHEGSAL